jgi:hypothetical protein
LEQGKTRKKGDSMRIAKATLMTRWGWSTGLAIAVFAILAALDLRLKALSGVGTADLASFSTPIQFRAAFFAWNAQPLALRAGFNLGFDYLLMPLYAASFFYSGIIAAEGFAPRPNALRRIILMAAMAPLIGAAADAAENALQIAMLLGGVSDTLVLLSSAASNIKNLALLIGLALLLGAIAARVQQRRTVRGAGNSGPKIPGLS